MGHYLINDDTKLPPYCLEDYEEVTELKISKHVLPVLKENVNTLGEIKQVHYSISIIQINEQC